MDRKYKNGGYKLGLIGFLFLLFSVKGQTQCIPSITISVVEQCSVQLTPSQVLNSIPLGLTASDLSVDIENYNGPGKYVFSVRLNPGVTHIFKGCKGNIEVIDLKAPVLEAPEHTTFRWEKISTNAIQREITAGNSKKIPQQINCFTGSLHSSLIPYDSLVFTVPENGFYSFFLISQFPSMASITKFGWEETCRNIIDAAEDFPKPRALKPGKDILDLAQNSWIQPNDTFDLRLSGNLKKGEKYILTNFSKTTTSVGKSVWIILTNQEKIPGDTLIVYEDNVVLPAQNRWLSIPLYLHDIEQLKKQEKYMVNGDGELLEGDSTLIDLLTKTGFPHTYSGNLNTPAPTILGGFQYYGYIRDSCGPIEINVFDQLIQEGDCMPKILERNFTAKDPSGNFSSLKKQLIQFRNPKMEEILFPSLSTFVGCGEDISPSNTGAPYYWSEKGRISYEMVGYSDLNESKICGGGYSFIRRWTIFDWCNPGTTKIFNQIIQVIDTTPPSFVLQNNLEISTTPNSCQAIWEVPSPDSLLDNCSEVFLKQILFVEKSEIVQPGDILLLDTGLYQFEYTVIDDCGLYSQKTLNIRVSDQISPNISCDAIRNVSFGYVEAQRFSEESFDHCSPINLSLRKILNDSCSIQAYLDEKNFSGTFENAILEKLIVPTGSNWFYTRWEEKIGINCCDTNNGETEVEVKAISSNNGLSATCFTRLKVEDKRPALCISPPDVELICGFSDWSDLRMFGNPGAEHECGFSFIELAAEFNLDHCQTGSIIRKFMVLNPSGILPDTCFQTITIKPNNEYIIEFPEDLKIEDCIDFLAPVPLWSSKGCDLITHSLDTTIFYTSSAACFEFKTRHRLLNWCEYEEGMDPVIIPSSGKRYIIKDSSGVYLDDNSDKEDGFIEKLNTSGYYEYSHTIRVQDKIPPEISHPNYPPVCAFESCLVKLQLPFIVQDACDNGGISFEFFYDENRDGIFDDILQLYSEDENQDSLFGIFGRAPKLTLVSFFPVGKHQLIVNALDGCGNKSSKAIPFEVLDCKPPAPTCIEGLSVELMPQNGGALVETSDFLVNIPEDCLGPVEFSIHRLEEKSQKGKTQLELDCDDLGLVKVKIVAWDQAYNPFSVQPDGTQGGPNYSFCVTTIRVQDNLSVSCINNTQGKVTSESGIGWEGVSVFFRENPGIKVKTDEYGNYEIFGDGILGAEYDGSHLSGISTYDLVLMSRHILGIEELKSDFEKIAADVNGSGSISTLDMIDLRKIILGISENFGSIPAWQLLKKEENNDFIIIKTGDINQSAFSKNPLIGRSLAYLETEDRIFMPNENVSVKISFKELFKLSGGQLGLEYDQNKLDLLKISAPSPWYHIKDGFIKILWTQEDLKNQDLELMFFSKTTSKVSESIKMNSKKFSSQGYGMSGEIHPLELLWLDIENSIRNFPNPFRSYTEIDLKGISDSITKMEVFTLSGVKILERVDLKESIRINQNDLKGSGAYWVILHREDKEILSFKIFHTHE